jgi:hypothetical protein
LGQLDVQIRRIDDSAENEAVIATVLSDIDKMTKLVEQSERLQHEMERELMIRNPVEKLIRRDNELNEIEQLLEEASERLSTRSDLMHMQPRNKGLGTKLGILDAVERMFVQVNDLKNRR